MPRLGQSVHYLVVRKFPGVAFVTAVDRECYCLDGAAVSLHIDPARHVDAGEHLPCPDPPQRVLLPMLMQAISYAPADAAGFQAEHQARRLGVPRKRFTQKQN